MTLVQGEDYYRTLVQLAPDVIYELAADGTFTSLSPAFSAITGWSVDEWLGKPFAGLVHPDDLPLAMERFGQSRRGETPAPYELRIRCRSGEYVVGEIRGMPKVLNGEVVGSVGVARDVTDRAQAQQLLKVSRDQLEAVLQSVDEGITVQGADGRIVFANATAAQLLGFPDVEALLAAGADISDRYDVYDELGEPMPPETRPTRRAQRGERVAAMLRFRIRDTGEEHWTLVRSTPVLDEHGVVRLAVNVFDDVTERRRAEEARLRLAAIVESSEDAIIGKTLDAIITSWNPAAERLYGYRPEEVIGRSISVIIPPEWPDELPGIMARVRRGEPIRHYETTRVRKDGTRVDVWVSISPIRDSKGHIIGAATIARDNTERKRAEKERAEILARETEARAQAEAAQARLAFLAQASEILGSSLDFETTLANVARLAVPALADWCTIEIVEEDGALRRIALTHPDPEKIAFARELEQRYPSDPESGTAQVIQTGESQITPEITDEMLVAAAQDEEHLRIIRELGLRSAMVVPLPTRNRILGAITLIAAESGRRYGPEHLALAEDLGRRAAVAVDNARLFKQAQDALRLREEFLSIASHELKTPLTSLQLQIQILDRFVRQQSLASLSPERAATILDGAGRQIRRLGRLIGDLLDVSRIAAGRLELERSRVDLGALAAEVVERFREEASAVGSEIHLSAQPDVVGKWDPFRLDQVVTNLISNAIKYGAGRPVEVEASCDRENAVLSVRDQGIGIEPQHLTRIFDRFERMTSSQSYGGLGLGLYIASQIVQAHAGRIEVESEPERGATFTVILPREARLEAGTDG